ETGLSVGTPYYMSPEQATGDQLVGPSSDIYALGAVLYELLTGDPPYMGSTAQAVLGQIIAGEPVSPSRKRRAIPANVDAAIRRSLEKLPADRFTSAADFARALGDPGFRHGEDARPGARGASGRWKAATLVGWTAAFGFAALAAYALSRPAPPAPVERFGAPFLPDQVPELIRSEAFTLSPDGTFLVYRMPAGSGAPALAIRRWDELSSTAVRETTGGQHPAVSPDGRELAFEVDQEVRVLSLAGGPVRRLTPGGMPHWGPDGWIYAAADSGIVRVPAAGGVVETVTRLQEGDLGLAMRTILPSGTEGLAMVLRADQTNEIRIVDLETGEMTFLVEGAHPTYLPSGHLVYGTGCDWIGSAGACSTMMAAPFDPDRVELLGPAVAIEDGLAAWSFSADGRKLFYSRGEAAGGIGPTRLTWVTRDGRATPVDPDWTFQRGADVNLGWSISPDGSRVALREQGDDGYDIWVKQLDDGPRSRLTFGEGHNRMPVWTADSRTVTFLSDRDGDGFAVWARTADGTGEPVKLVDPPQDVATIAWTQDGNQLLLRTSTGNQETSERDVLIFQPGVDTAATPLLAAPYREISPQVSPDGRWIVYASDETGRYEIYVRPFPDVAAGRWQISVDGGRNPRWSPAGDEIFFVDPDNQMMAAAVNGSGERFASNPAQLLFGSDPSWLTSNLSGLFYDVAPDGRFMVAEVVTTREEGDTGPSVVLVNNFVEIIQQQVPR
ncbi:MAG: hypothetical protein R3253_02160, partial [Longimicrobiales bacterium]|nr:hypothetical protein [Longimicrobiales bacterium]